MSSVSHAEVAGWVSELSATGLAPGSVRYVHAVMASLTGLAVRDGRIIRNPAVGVPLPRVRRRQPRFLSAQEVARLAAAAGKEGDAIRLLAFTGLRFGELAGLRVRRVDPLRRRTLWRSR